MEKCYTLTYRATGFLCIVSLRVLKYFLPQFLFTHIPHVKSVACMDLVLIFSMNYLQRTDQSSHPQHMTIHTIANYWQVPTFMPNTWDNFIPRNYFENCDRFSSAKRVVIREFLCSSVVSFREFSVRFTQGIVFVDQSGLQSIYRQCF